MLALLSAPRGRVSAARLAARAAREDDDAPAGIIIRLPGVPSDAPAALRSHLRLLPAGGDR